MSTYVLVHGAWHTGAELEPTAAPIRAAGHEVHTPTLAGNRPGDKKSVGLADAIKSLVDYLTEKNLKDIVLLGHSYGGMVITGAADQVPDRIRRLIYWNAFVPNNGESLNDMVPPPYVALFEAVAAQRGDNSVVLPFPIWREAFINDADLETRAEGLQHSQSASGENILRQNLDQDQSGGPADRQVVHQLYGRHVAAASLPVASAAVAEIGAVPPGADARQSRALLLQSKAAGASHHGGRPGLIGETSRRQTPRIAHMSAFTTDAFSTKLTV